MKIAIMQPYLFPYIGYWQLIAAVDKFVIYDNIQYEKNGWMRRNRIMSGGRDKMFSVPIAKGSDYDDVRERKLTDNYLQEVAKILRVIKHSYSQAPYFNIVYPIIEECFNYKSDNLFEYILYSVRRICEYLEIDTEIVVSSNLDINHSLKREYRVLEICKHLGGDIYINPEGGMSLYSREQFLDNGIKLQFLKAGLSPYNQGKGNFIPALSIVDMMMNISKDEIKQQIKNFTLL